MAREGKGEIIRRILVTDDDPAVLSTLNEILTREGYSVITASNGEECLVMAKVESPDLIVLDIVMPGMDGKEVKTKLNEDTSTASIPVVFLTGKGATADKVEGFNLGIDDYITKPFELDELLARVRGALTRRGFYERISMTDALTGLYNRHYFDKQFELFFNIAKRYQQMFSLVIVDIDNFKEINDTYSHTVGDFVLRKLSSVMTDTLRKSDIVTRYGGDEFAIILPGSDREQAKKAMGRVSDKINSEVYIFGDKNDKLDVSISIGVAAYSEDMGSAKQLFEIADADMYRVKKASREKE